MASPQSIQVLAPYLVLLCALGWASRRFNATFEEFFAGGRCMRWWLLGAESFQSNFSSWVFTGAAGIAYAHGMVIFGFYLVDVLSFALAWLWFARWFRQLRVVTAIDAVRLRFGAKNERFFALLSVGAAIAGAALRVLALTVVFCQAFSWGRLPVVGTILVVVVFVALLGGNRGVAAMSFVQLTLVVGVTTTVAAIAVVRVGGWSAFIAQIPEGHWELFPAVGTGSYDWLFIVSGLLGATHAKNNLLFVSKYMAARDATEARRSAIVPLLGYLIMPLVWMVPVFAAFTLVPGLEPTEAAGHPGEGTYIAVCAAILSPGLFSLVLLCMLASTLSSVGSALNVNAGTLTRILHAARRRVRPRQRELVAAGRWATLLLGVATGMVCLLFSETGRSLFDLGLYVGAYVGVPIGIPLFMGILVRGEPRWAPLATAAFVALLTVLVYHGLPRLLAAWAPPHLLAKPLGYLASHPFTATNLVIAPSGALFFVATRLCRVRGASRLEHRRQAGFFKRMHQPGKAVSRVPAAELQQERLLGRFLTAAAVLLGLLGLMDHSTGNAVGILGCAALPATLALVMFIHSRTQLARSGAVIRGDPRASTGLGERE